MVLASAVFFLVLFVEGDMECGWFLLVAGSERGAGESGLQFVVATWGGWFLQVAVWRMDRVVVISVVSQRQGSQCQLCNTRDSTVQFFAKVLTCPCCACRNSAENRGLPAVAGIDMVVDVPVMQFVLVG